MTSLLLVHGAGSGPWAFTGWAESFPGARVEAVDLQAGLDVGSATIDDYADAVVRAAEPLPRPLAVVGWSLGGLAALCAAARVQPEALVLLEASPPLEMQGLRAEMEPAEGTFLPDAPGSRPESSLAMGQRDRGVSVPGLPSGTRTLVVCGDAFLHDRGPGLAEHYGGELLEVGTLGHRELVTDLRLREQIKTWLDATPGD